VKKKSTNKKLRLALHGQTVRALRDLTLEEFEQAIGAIGCGTPATSFGQDACTGPH
jgi:hypothetical protein